MACCSSGCSRDPTGTLSCLLAHLCAGEVDMSHGSPQLYKTVARATPFQAKFVTTSEICLQFLPQHCQKMRRHGLLLAKPPMSCPTHSPSDLSGSHLPRGGPKPCPVLDFPRVFLLRDLRNPTCPTAWSARTPKTRERVPRPCRRTAPQRTARIYCATRWQHAACCRRDCAHLRRS